MMQANRNEHDGASVAGASIPSQVSMPQHGPHARSRNQSTIGAVTISPGTVRSQITYDHNGNIVPPS